MRFVSPSVVLPCLTLLEGSSFERSSVLKAIMQSLIPFAIESSTKRQNIIGKRVVYAPSPLSALVVVRHRYLDMTDMLPRLGKSKTSVLNLEEAAAKALTTRGMMIHVSRRPAIIAPGRAWGKRIGRDRRACAVEHIARRKAKQKGKGGQTLCRLGRIVVT